MHFKSVGGHSPKDVNKNEQRQPIIVSLQATSILHVAPRSPAMRSHAQPGGPLEVLHAPKVD